jgi:mono/diheme cytochrome c family protein
MFRFALTAAAAAGLFVCACVSPGDLTAGENGGAAAAALGRKNPIPADGKSLAAGREVYTANCADCHGPRGKGDGRMAKDLKKRPPDLTDPEVASEPDDVLFNRISRGRKPMPSFEKLLTEQERWHVVNYVHKLAAAK